jgi:hypothetical protein
MPTTANKKIQRIGILEMAAPDPERLALWVGHLQAPAG